MKISFMKTGVAFPDYIRTEKVRRRDQKFGSEGYSMRALFIPTVLVVAVGILFARLFFLQIVKGSYYRDLSDGNRIRTIAIHAQRGIIFDRNEKPLVFNTPGFRQTVNGKTKLIGNEEAISLISQGKKDLETDSLRSYPYNDNLAHVLGYIGQIFEDELSLLSFKDYNPGDLIGKMGIERKFESILKGIDGESLVEVDSGGNIVRKLGQKDPIPGENITLTIDLELQKAVYNAMGGVKKGASIVSKPNGEVLALVSKPSFDPNLFTMSDIYKTASESSYKNIDQILLDEESQPLINRTIQGTYPPGSTFKIIVAAAGLENKIIDENFTVEDTGVLRVGDFSFSNWYFTQYGGKEGEVDVVKGLKRSNDIFFYKLGELVGVDKLSKFAEKFGLGDTLGIDLLGEEKGIVPTEDWKKKVIGEQWYLGDTYHYGIGQGFLLVTPLQVNAWTQVIANGGDLYTPHLLKSSKFKVQSSKLLSEKNLSLIRQGMVESCEPGGVAWPLFKLKIKNEKLKIDGRNFLTALESSTSGDLKDYREISIACKTGTAQHGGEETLPHAWITLFAPAYDPQIVVTVLSESSGEGSNVAAPVAKKILEEWFSR